LTRHGVHDQEDFVGLDGGFDPLGKGGREGGREGGRVGKGGGKKGQKAGRGKGE
jgi:hypothetical protein